MAGAGRSRPGPSAASAGKYRLRTPAEPLEDEVAHQDLGAAGDDVQVGAPVAVHVAEDVDLAARTSARSWPATPVKAPLPSQLKASFASPCRGIASIAARSIRSLPESKSMIRSGHQLLAVRAQCDLRLSPTAAEHEDVAAAAAFEPVVADAAAQRVVAAAAAQDVGGRVAGQAVIAGCRPTAFSMVVPKAIWTLLVWPPPSLKAPAARSMRLLLLQPEKSSMSLRPRPRSRPRDWR